MLELATAWPSLDFGHLNATQIALAAVMGISAALFLITRFRVVYLVVVSAAAISLMALR